MSIIVSIFLLHYKRKPRAEPKQPKPQTVLEYDSEGYNRQGYNAVVRNRQGKYNRYYNVRCYLQELHSEEGFLDIRKNPLYLTNHAKDRMRERMGINESYIMEQRAFEAYQFVKSKCHL